MSRIAIAGACFAIGFATAADAQRGASAERRHYSAPTHAGSHHRSFVPPVYRHVAPPVTHRPITRVAPVVHMPRPIGIGRAYAPRVILPYAVPVDVPAPVSVFVDTPPPPPAPDEPDDPAPVLMTPPPEYGRVIIMTPSADGKPKPIRQTPGCRGPACL